MYTTTASAAWPRDAAVGAIPIREPTQHHGAVPRVRDRDRQGREPRTKGGVVQERQLSTTRGVLQQRLQRRRQLAVVYVCVKAR